MFAAADLLEDLRRNIVGDIGDAGNGREIVHIAKNAVGEGIGQAAVVLSKFAYIIKSHMLPVKICANADDVRCYVREKDVAKVKAGGVHDQRLVAMGKC